MKKKMIILIFLGISIFCNFAMAETVDIVDFNTSTDLTDNFIDDGSPVIIYNDNAGINSTGCLEIPDGSQNDCWTTKTGYSVTGEGDVYKFSGYFINAANSGYAGFGFTNSGSNTATNTGPPEPSIGIQFHGGGGAFLSNGNSIKNLTWSGGDMDCGGTQWYYMVLTIEAEDSDQYSMNFEIYPSSSNGTLGALKTSHDFTITNSEIRALSTLHGYLYAAGNRMKYVDNYQIELGGEATVVEPGMPVVLSSEITSIAATSAVGGGDVIDDNDGVITERGVCWGESLDPTVSGDYETAGGTTGAYAVDITGLTAGRTYYARAYATNSIGTSYGANKSFETLSSPGNALDFDGDGATVTFASNFTSPVDNWTMSAWFKPSTLEGGEQTIFYNGDDSGGYGICLEDNTVKVLYGMISWHSLVTIQNANQWYHLAMKRSNGTLIVLLNGKQLAYTSTDTPNAPYSLATIGSQYQADHETLHRFFSGQIDEAQFFDVVLTNEQIRANMNKPLVGNEANLTAYYKFDHSSGVSLSDHSSNSNTGTLNYMNDADWISSDAMIYTPIATAGTSITTSTFTANWEENYTATEYRLDVATDNTFTTYLTGYENKVISDGATVSESVTGITGGIDYCYRVRAYNGNTLQTSDNSNIITIDAAPDQNIVVTDLSYATEDGGVWTETDQTINEGETGNFSITATDPDSNPLVYSWKMRKGTDDFVEQSTESTYDFTTDNTSAGTYTVTLVVTDNFGNKKLRKAKNSLSYSWIVTVTDVDQNIVVTDLSYATEDSGVWTEENQSINEGETGNFSITATDPDNNPLVYSWKMRKGTDDFVEQSTEATYDFTTDNTSAGTYTVTLAVTDNFGNKKLRKAKNSLSYSWIVTVTDVDQNIVVTDLSYATEDGGVWTETDQTINEGETGSFSITATDPDGNPLVYSWKMRKGTDDFVEKSTEATYDFTTDFNSEGTYTVTLNVTDFVAKRIKSKSVISKNKALKAKISRLQSKAKIVTKTKNSLSYSWTVTVEDVNTAPTITSFLPEGITVNVGSDPQAFRIIAEDTEGDALIYSWFVDDIEQDSISFTFTSPFSFGNHTVKAVVSDGVLTADNNWTIISSSSIDNNLPVVTELKQNYPNPFNPATTISYSLAEEGEVRVVIYNSAGNIVADLVNKKQARGNYNVKWNGSNLTSGLYFIRMKAGNYHKNIKAMLVK